MPHLKLEKNQSIQMHGASFTIGSDPTCDLPISGRGVLPRHIILQSRGDRWQVAKLTLDAPVFINNRPVDSLALLNDGDQIKIGDITFVWQEKNVVFEEENGPWKGLVLILLTVLVMLSFIFIWFGYSDFQLGAPPTASASATSIPKQTPQNAPPPKETPLCFDKMGHPVYWIVLPTPQP